MSHRRQEGRSTPRPLDRAALDRLAIGYVGRYATTRAKLARYLARKLAERGWAEGEAEPAPVEAIVARCQALGYLDDAQFAAQRGAALTRAGYGMRRVAQALEASGVGRDDARPVLASAEEEALAAAMAFARRRRIGPHAPAPHDEAGRRRAVAAMVRAGHAPALAWRIVRATAAEELD